MNRMFKTIGIGTATVLGVITLSGQPVLAESPDPESAAQQLAHSSDRHPHQGPGSGMMMTHAMAPMMGDGDGSAMMGIGASHCTEEKELSAQDVRKIIDGRLAWNGNKRLKVGDVTKKDDDTYVADIVTVDDSLVERIEMDRNTGVTRRAQGAQ